MERWESVFKQAHYNLMTANKMHTLAEGFLLIGAELSPNSHSWVFESFKNPSSLSLSMTYNIHTINDSRSTTNHLRHQNKNEQNDTERTECYTVILSN